MKAILCEMALVATGAMLASLAIRVWIEYSPTTANPALGVPVAKQPTGSSSS